MPNVLYSKIEQKLLELEQIPNSMIVLKGIPMEAVFPEYAEKIQLETLTKNKLGYMMNLVSERSIITYEEFLLLYDFIVSQYSAVFILPSILKLSIPACIKSGRCSIIHKSLELKI